MTPHNEPGATLAGVTPAENLDPQTVAAPAALANGSIADADAEARERRYVHQAMLRVLARRGERTLRELLAVYGASKVPAIRDEFLASVASDCSLLVPLHEAIDTGSKPGVLAPMAPPSSIAWRYPVLPRVLPPATAASLDRVAANLPAELLAMPAFVCGSRKLKRASDGTWKSDKAPIDPTTGRAGKSNKPRTWAAFAVARAYAIAHADVFGVGVNLLGSDYTGLDLDHVLVNGLLRAEVRDVLAGLPATYCERSPSGDGLRLFYSGRKPAWLRGSAWADAFGPGVGLEVYDGSGGRYLTVTGDVVDLAALCAGGAV